MYTALKKARQNGVVLLLLLATVCLGLYSDAFLFSDKRIWLTLLVNFIFFVPLAAGMVTWPAIIYCSRGTWTDGMERAALRAFWFVPVSMLLLIFLWFGKAYWAPWPQMVAMHPIWLSSEFIFARAAVALMVFILLATFFVKRYSNKLLGTFLILSYCIAFTIIGFDFVMGPKPNWYSALFGGYFFISGLYAAITAWTLAYTFAKELKTEVLEDLTKLIITFSLLTTYLMYSQLIVIWYENLPGETPFILMRLNLEPWKYFSAWILGVVYLGPLVLFLTRRARTSRMFVKIVCVILLAGLWLERWWLVVPGVQGGYPRPGLLELISGVAFASLFLLIYNLSRIDYGRAK